MNYFQKETPDVLATWDGRIHMCSVVGQLDLMELTQPLPCGDGFIPAGFRWNGASSGIFQRLIVLHFPKWKHPIATCRHDFRCENTQNANERKISDILFRDDVGIGGTKWEQIKGYAGVRAGALLGIGNNF